MVRSTIGRSRQIGRCIASLLYHNLPQYTKAGDGSWLLCPLMAIPLLRVSYRAWQRLLRRSSHSAPIQDDGVAPWSRALSVGVPWALYVGQHAEHERQQLLQRVEA